MNLIRRSIKIIIICIFCMQALIPLHVGNTEAGDNYLETIKEIILWKKDSLDIPMEEPVLNNIFLKNAGDTTGDWFPIGLGRIGYPDNYEAYLAVIENELTDRYKGPHLLSESKATEWHRISLAILAMGGDPTQIGRDQKGEPINLIADGTYNRAEMASIGEQGLNGWIWALITLDSFGYAIPEDAKTTREDIIIEILQAQLDDGGFSLSENNAEPDMTGMAITALAPYYNSEESFTYMREGTSKEVTHTIREVVDEAIATLSTIQLDSGGFATMDMENTESIVQVIVALSSLGIDIHTDERFIKNDRSMYDALMSFQMPDGGFAHSNEYDEDNPTAKPGESNAMATDQALYALVSLYRYEQEERNLFDLRPEMTEDVKKSIKKVEEEINKLPNDSDVVEDIFTMYKDIPVEERSYVYNYANLAEALTRFDIENDSEAISQHIGVNKSGKPMVVPLFSGSIDENGEVTEEDLVKIARMVEADSTEYEIEVITLLKKLKAAKKDYVEEIGQLEKEKENIEQLQKEINHLNEKIVEELFPFEDITESDAQAVQNIMQRYEELSDYDKEKIVNYEDVEKAEAQIKSMKRNKFLMILFGSLFMVTIGLYIYRRKKRKEKKKATSYKYD